VNIVATTAFVGEANARGPSLFEPWEGNLMTARICCLFTLAALGCAGTSSDSSDHFKIPSVSLGKESALTDRSCNACHGADLAGGVKPINGMMMFVDKASDTAACPANLTPDATGLADWDEATIVRAILTGKDDENKDLNPAMPRYGTMGMSDGEAKSIAMYLKSIKAVSKSIDDAPTCK
jgi:hypothetical protein